MASVIESITDAAASVAAGLANLNIGPTDEIKEMSSASGTEGRRLYIGNLAYAATEEQVKDTFCGYAVVSCA